MSPTQWVGASRDGAVALVEIRRPEKLNALSYDVVAQLVEALVRADADPDVGAVVLTGCERAFAAGGDIGEWVGRAPLDPRIAARFALRDRIADLEVPLIAAVRGLALGGGCELAMSCDIVIAGTDTKFAQPEVRLGLVPGSGGTQRLARAVGKFRAMDILLTGRSLSAEEAFAAGLVSRVVPPERVLSEAMAVAHEIGRLPRAAVRAVKALVLAADESPLSQGLALERRWFDLMFATEDAQEGMRAFCEKRPPAFGRRGGKPCS